MVFRKLRTLTILGSLAAATTVFALSLFGGQTSSAFAGGAAPCYGNGTFPVFAGTPPWGYRTGPTPAATASYGSFARAYGDINLYSGKISGHICQVNVVKGIREQIIINPVSPIIYHTHTAEMWGYPGNEVKTHIIVKTSNDPNCAVGTKGLMTMYASYNNVRSDSIQFQFAKGCSSHNHLYHGSQVNAQVPPL